MKWEWEDRVMGRKVAIQPLARRPGIGDRPRQPVAGNTGEGGSSLMADEENLGAEPIQETDQAPIQPRPLPTHVAAAELREALLEEMAWQERVLAENIGPNELQGAAKGCVSAHLRVKAARAQVMGEAGLLELPTRTDERPRSV